MRRVIACEVFKYEMETLGLKEGEGIFLRQGLHRTPDDLRTTLQENIDQLESGGYSGTIIIGYGLCGNGVVGVKSKSCELVIANCDDCIDVFLGSRQARARDVAKGNAYYFSPGWVAFSLNVYTEYQRCLPLYGEETARWIVSEMLKGYNRISYIDTGHQSAAVDRDFVREVAGTFNLPWDEVKGSLEWLSRLLRCKGEDIIRIKPGQTIEADFFHTGTPPE